MSSEGRVNQEVELKVPESPPRCINGCGFYGNATTHNLCSKCYKDFCLQKSKPSTATASKTLQLQHKESQQLSIPSLASGGPLEDKPTVVADAVDSSPEAKRKNRCMSCTKKVGLLGFSCKCGNTFCSKHRYPEMHDCDFDYKAEGQEAIVMANPLVKPNKIQRI